MRSHHLCMHFNRNFSVNLYIYQIWNMYMDNSIHTYPIPVNTFESSESPWMLGSSVVSVTGLVMCSLQCQLQSYQVRLWMWAWVGGECGWMAWWYLSLQCSSRKTLCLHPFQLQILGLVWWFRLRALAAQSDGITHITSWVSVTAAPRDKALSRGLCPTHSSCMHIRLYKHSIYTPHTYQLINLSINHYIFQ